MTLGLINGLRNLALNWNGLYSIVSDLGSYGALVGNSGNITGSGTGSIGVTNDPTKSGIVASFDGIDIGTINSLKLGKYILKY